ADDGLLLVLDELPAPVREDGDLAVQALDRGTQLAPVLLDRGADLLGCARRGHRRLLPLLAHQRSADLAGLVDRHLGDRRRAVPEELRGPVAGETAEQE